MKKKLACILLIVCSVFASCERRSLYDVFDGSLFLEIYIQAEVETETKRSVVPVGMSVNFHNADDHLVYLNTIMSSTGGFVTINPGIYELLVYNYDTEYTRVRNESHSRQAEAFTNEAPGNVRRAFEMLKKALAAARGEDSREYADEPLINQPDHLYVGKLDQVEVPVALEDGEVMHVKVFASTILEKYQLIVKGVKGLPYISSAEAFVSGQGSSKLLYDREISGGPATLFMTLEDDNDSEDQLSAYFTTFGKYDKEHGKVYAVLRIVDKGGKIYTWEFDVTSQVDSGSHVITVEANIEIEPTEGSGGFESEITDWENIITNIDM